MSLVRVELRTANIVSLYYINRIVTKLIKNMKRLVNESVLAKSIKNLRISTQPSKLDYQNARFFDFIDAT